MQPDLPLHGLEGVKHLASATRPGIYDPALADDMVEVSTENAYATARRLAREAGIFVGPSSGANVYAATEVARKLGTPAKIVTVLCDGGERYTRERIFD
jgi:cysteine synthase B